jgi:hypothetical protein
MLVYHPAFDIYHTLYRSIKILFNKNISMEVLRLRIYDYYLLFPGEIINLKFPQKLLKQKKYFKFPDNPYNTILEPRIVFNRISHIQYTAYNCLSAYNFIAQEEYKNGRLTLLTDNIPDDFLKIINYSEMDIQVINFLLSLNEVPLFGNNGLKERSNLMDSKYDNV